MLEDKKLKEIESRVKNYIAEGIIKKGNSEHLDFFLKNSENSLDSARALMNLSTDIEKQKIFGFVSFNGMLWVVNSSYYSMFYITRALLEKEGVKIKTNKSIHAITFDALVYYFYLTGRLQKEFLKDFLESEEDCAELLGKEKAEEIIEDYFYEKNKRAKFTYEMGEIILKSKAKTSLERAQRFRRELMKLINKK